MAIRSSTLPSGVYAVNIRGKVRSDVGLEPMIMKIQKDQSGKRSRSGFRVNVEVRFTILPLQRIEGHTRAIKIIDIWPPRTTSNVRLHVSI